MLTFIGSMWVTVGSQSCRILEPGCEQREGGRDALCPPFFLNVIHRDHLVGHEGREGHRSPRRAFGEVHNPFDFVVE